MDDNPRALTRLSIILGGLVAAALLVFLVTGGDLGGTQKVQGDADLPQVASPTPPSAPDNTGSR
jgi:hypothetical protein